MLKHYRQNMALKVSIVPSLDYKLHKQFEIPEGQGRTTLFYSEVQCRITFRTQNVPVIHYFFTLYLPNIKYFWPEFQQRYFFHLCSDHFFGWIFTSNLTFLNHKPSPYFSQYLCKISGQNDAVFRRYERNITATLCIQKISPV